MIPYIRRKKILDEFEKKDVIYVEELVESLKDISLSTIRRDLRTLEEEGQIVLLRGGAARLKVGLYDLPIKTKELYYKKEKNIIAEYAASLVNDGEVIYIDSGSTTFQMINYLKNKQITVVTSNTQILTCLSDTKLKCIMLGGEVTNTLSSVVGPITDRLLSEMFFDKAFLGTSGYSYDGGINTHDFRESNKKRIVQNNSKKTYVLADHSKCDKRALSKAFDINECIIISDKLTDTLEKYATYIIAEESKK